MEALQFGPISIEESEDGIDFIPAAEFTGKTRIRTDDVPILMNFLKKHLEESANRRSSWRLSVTSLAGTDADGLRVAIGAHGKTVVAQVIDISLTGMLVQVEEPIGERGEVFDIGVEYGVYYETLVGTIVRQDDSMRRLAFHFADCIDEQGALCPPTEYREIFIALEHIWLDKKLGLQWN